MAVSEEAVKQAIFILYATMAVFVEFLIIFLCYWLMPIERRARFMSFSFKKSYGVVEVVGKGKKITKHLVSLYKDYAKVRGGIFILNPNYVYIKDGCPVIHYDEKDAFIPTGFTKEGKTKRTLGETDFKEFPKEIQKQFKDLGIKKLKKLYSEKEVKKFFYQPKDMKRDKPKDKVFDPQAISSIFVKQKALAESEALLKMIKTFRILLLVAAGAAMIAAAIAYMNYDVLSGGDMLAGLIGG